MTLSLSLSHTHTHTHTHHVDFQRQNSETADWKASLVMETQGKGSHEGSATCHLLLLLLCWTPPDCYQLKQQALCQWHTLQE